MSYPKYRESGEKWLGSIPAHWETSRLKHLFSLAKRLPEEGDGIVTAFRDGEVTLRSNRRVDGFTNAVHEHGYQRILKGDLVIHAMDAFAGAIGVSDANGKSTPVYSVCTPKSKAVNSHFFAQLLRYMALSGYINSLSKGIRERSTEFRWNEAASVILAVPPLDEQIQIVAFIDQEAAKIDKLIEEKRRLIERLKEKHQAVISYFVTRGLNPHAPLKSSGTEWLGSVPAHWNVERGRFLFRKLDIPPEPDDGVVTAFRDGQVTLRTNRRTEGFTFAVLEVGYQRVRTGDLVIHGMDAFAGAIGVSESTGKCTPEYSVMTPARSGIDNSYFALVLRLMSQRNFISVICPSVRERAPRFRFEAFKDVHLPVPPIEEQNAIMRAINSTAEETVALTAEAQRAIDLLQERRTALISAAVTGQIDVRHWQPTSGHQN